MAWSDMPAGCFTGIEWSQPGATEGVDPYLVWAESDRFAGYGGLGSKKRLPVAIELHPDCTVEKLIAAVEGTSLQVPEVYQRGPQASTFRFCTGLAGPEFFREVQPGGCLHSIVKRVELGLAAGERLGHDVSRKGTLPVPQGADALHLEARELNGKVLGLIDDSCALAHMNFMDADGLPRIAFFWRQDEAGMGDAPAPMGYGREIRAAHIREAMLRNTTESGCCDESGVYIDLGLSGLGDRSHGAKPGFHALDLPGSHGTLVLDLAAGPRALTRIGTDPLPFAKASLDDAARCPLVAVQLDCDTVQDTSGGSMNVGILDALMYILSRCGPEAQVTVNISFGTLAGPHDGTSLLEAAMDQLIELHQNRLQIVLAAGNGYQSRTHANIPLTTCAGSQAPWQHETATLNWVVQPDDETQSFVELWVWPAESELTVQITPPGHPDPLPPLSRGESKMWVAAGQSLPCCAVIYPTRVATGEQGTCILIAVAPTSARDPHAVTAPSGTWKIRLRLHSGEAVVDAYIERDDILPGPSNRGRQSHFEDEHYDFSAEIDDPGNPTLIRRSGSLNSIATGRCTLSVGATRMVQSPGLDGTDGKWSRYSPRCPDPDAARPARPGVVKVPRREAFGDEHCAREGVIGAGARSGSVVRLKGTSAAAPQVTRQLLTTAPAGKRE